MLESTIKYAAEVQADTFRNLFAKVSGWVDRRVEANPQGACTMSEVGELFNILFERMLEKDDETPAAGTAGESR